MTNHTSTSDNLPDDSRRFAPARCAWEVRAGVIPDIPLQELTRIWGLTSAEYESPQSGELFTARLKEASDYAAQLQNPRQVNWVQLYWIWF